MDGGRFQLKEEATGLLRRPMSVSGRPTASVMMVMMMLRMYFRTLVKVF